MIDCGIPGAGPAGLSMAMFLDGTMDASEKVLGQKGKLTIIQLSSEIRPLVTKENSRRKWELALSVQ